MLGIFTKKTRREQSLFRVVVFSYGGNLQVLHKNMAKQRTDLCFARNFLLGEDHLHQGGEMEQPTSDKNISRD